MKKIAPLILVALAVAIGLGWYFRVPQALGLVAPEKTALTLYGNVDIRQVSLAFRVSGRLSQVLVDEGDTVKAGDVLAQLDSQPNEYAVAAAAANVAALSATLEKLKAGPRTAEIAQARAAFNESLASLNNARIAFERAAELRPQGTISQAAFDQAESEKDVAAARSDSARQALRLLEEGNRPEDIAYGAAQLQAAEAALETARTTLSDTALKAPEDGIILSRVEEPGAVLAAGGPVLVLSLAKPVWVRAYIDEPDLGRIHPGLKVKVTSDTRPDAPYDGTVGFISPVAEFTPKSVETPALRTDLVYRLRIVIDNPGEDLRQGMPVTVRLPESTAAAK